MAFFLSFNLARESVCKRVSFVTKEQKDAYVEAELHDPVCRELWLRYQSARTLSKRRELAESLDSHRYKFYKKWIEDNPSEVSDQPPPKLSA
jgi:hypothetical protein